MSKVTGLFMLTCGAAIGAWVAWSKAREYYEEKTQEAIDSVKAAYSQAKELEKEGAVEDVHEEEIEDEPPITKQETPYGISSAEYGTRKGYTAIQLVLFADGVLADEEGVVYKEEVVGVDMLELLLENDEDAIYIRNDTVMRDFEVITDARDYDEVSFQPTFDPEDL